MRKVCSAPSVLINAGLQPFTDVSSQGPMLNPPRGCYRAIGPIRGSTPCGDLEVEETSRAANAPTVFVGDCTYC